MISQSDRALEQARMSEPGWVNKLAAQYGAKQAAALRGDETTFKAADMWLAMIAEHHWHEIIAALRVMHAANAKTTYVNRCPHEWYQGRCIHCDIKAVDGRPEQPDRVGIAGVKP